MERADQIVLSSPFVTFSGERRVFKTSVRGVCVVDRKKKTIHEAWGDVGVAFCKLFKPVIEELEKLAEKVARYLDD